MDNIRRFDWRTRLDEYRASCERASFEWGRLDCALFVAGAVKVMTGIDLADGLRGQYATEQEGLTLVRRLGFASHVDVFARALPRSRRLRPGDVALVAHEGGETLGIVQGRGIYVMTPTRLGMVPRRMASGGFSV